MIKHFEIKNFSITFVFRHKWDKVNKDYGYDFNTYELGLFCRRDFCVGKREFSKVQKWGKNLVPNYMIGLKLLVVKCWISFACGAMYLKE